VRRRRRRDGSGTTNLSMIDIFVGVLGGVVVLAAVFSAMLGSDEAIRRETYLVAHAEFTFSGTCNKAEWESLKSFAFVLKDEGGREVSQNPIERGQRTGPNSCTIDFWLPIEPLQPGTYSLGFQPDFNPLIPLTGREWRWKYRFLASGPEQGSWHVVDEGEGSGHLPDEQSMNFGRTHKNLVISLVGG